MRTAVAFFFIALAAYAQTSGTMSGAVSDKSGARVPGAKIVTSNGTTGEKRETVSAANGQ
ncbi:MAG: carboxypeptidase regulatory-like domain-containing protein [Acidobacteria bacterium]|nr:carboxypeptidase regulatory-like domain-containing protein [Acidobacteriota bacterium]